MREMKIIDMHVHAFPDSLAPRAMKSLMETTRGITACTGGTIGELLESMDNAGIESSWVLNIATRESQFEPILRWCREIRSERIVPFPSLCPSGPEACEQVGRIAQEGFPGLKIHPVYQNFVLDDPALKPFYRAVEENNLILICHTGFYLSFPKERLGDSVRVRTVLEWCPELKFVTTHFGGWNDWEEAERYIIGNPVYMDVSYSIPFLDRAKAREMLLRHPADYILFGTDSPWEDQSVTLAKIRSLKLPGDLEEKILYGNARALLRSVLL